MNKEDWVDMHVGDWSKMPARFMPDAKISPRRQLIAGPNVRF
jgi:hypothetical protein